MASDLACHGLWPERALQGSCCGACKQARERHSDYGELRNQPLRCRGTGFEVLLRDSGGNGFLPGDAHISPPNAFRNSAVTIHRKYWYAAPASSSATDANSAASKLDRTWVKESRSSTQLGPTAGGKVGSSTTPAGSRPH